MLVLVQAVLRLERGGAGPSRMRNKTSARNTALALPRPTAAPTATLALHPHTADRTITSHCLFLTRRMLWQAKDGAFALHRAEAFHARQYPGCAAHRPRPAPRSRVRRPLPCEGGRFVFVWRVEHICRGRARCRPFVVPHPTSLPSPPPPATST